MARKSRQELKKKRQRAYIRGHLAETYASFYLRLKGYRIVARHYRKPFGEIDIIASRKKTLIAIEVKTRRTMTDAVYSIGSIQKRRVKKAMQAFVIEKSKYESFDIRFDALLVTSFLRLPHHIENAWQ